ncbi:uncharacterized protein B0I36DRAFT_317894 [Microdochium trichocladiopsis]|uniref:Uncharacterized protein n=1 Tax=Microdochium trichocladiopsis TaxID=1682393 RepID=A0A9P8YC74_9PEZI|nr:uncharacterized protein B0I36DRAFT_317894 [Microdochium trichocladiopsis]KAH7035225.1 hypothetical protein B0I36DRAFT_317894 [Microdochium trichocladiopsis]
MLRYGTAHERGRCGRALQNFGSSPHRNHLELLAGASPGHRQLRDAHAQSHAQNLKLGGARPRFKLARLRGAQAGRIHLATDLGERRVALGGLLDPFSACRYFFPPCRHPHRLSMCYTRGACAHPKSTSRRCSFRQLNWDVHLPVFHSSIDWQRMGTGSWSLIRKAENETTVRRNSSSQPNDALLAQNKLRRQLDGRHRLELKMAHFESDARWHEVASQVPMNVDFMLVPCRAIRSCAGNAPKGKKKKFGHVARGEQRLSPFDWLNHAVVWRAWTGHYCPFTGLG